MKQLPAQIDLEQLFSRLEREETVLAQKLAELESRFRQFEDIDRPAYERWVRIEFGSRLGELEEILEKIREKQLLAGLVERYVRESGLGPREALYLALNRGDSSGEEQEVQARRQARLEAKREARREKKQEAKRAKKEAAPAAPGNTSPLGTLRSAVVSVYRKLARRLHPDSPDAVRGERAQTLWLEVQSAYSKRNLDRLLAIAAWLDSNQEPDGTGPRLTVSERNSRIRALKRSIERLAQKLESLGEHPAWIFAEPGGVSRKKLRSRVAREIEDELAQVQEVYQALEDFIESLGTPKRPR